MNSEGHLRAIARFLPLSGKSMSGCTFLVGDNCAVKKRLTNLIGVPLVGCASHRLNLAVRDYLALFDSELEEVQQLMHKLRTLKQTAKLSSEGASGQATLLSEEEEGVLEPFKRCSGIESVAQPQPKATEGFVERILNRRKVRDAPVAYTLLGAIPPTSNMMERLFSVARAVLRHERHRLSPILLETILFLKPTSTFWNVATVEQCL
ncbi:unnamed protein product [Phytophthora fragariaefolia]|uniref:Unnamed protein product n=1 Tax=Phytophthora fragariaefolia TaxID=1490495 RepID=A0A9W6YGS1_9STRA|nr:unnamed protein product [Phytophthora fragariaefolia]